MTFGKAFEKLNWNFLVNYKMPRMYSVMYLLVNVVIWLYPKNAPVIAKI